MTEPFESAVLDRRELAPGAFVLRFERHGLGFIPGQYIKVGAEYTDIREYSIYSSIDDKALEILVRHVPEGSVSSALSLLERCDKLHIMGPMGDFILPREPPEYPLLFVAGGTGIAPFHSMTSSTTGLNYTLLHGIGEPRDRFEHDHYDSDRVISCISRSPDGDFKGRVTDYLSANPVAPQTECYLCGSCDMIYDAFAILTQQGIPRRSIHAETYY